MLTPIASLLLGTLAVLPAPAPTAAPAGGDNWIADFDKAVELARREGKDLFVDFTGSDWCGWCKRLDKEVFSHEAFLTPAQKQFVLVALDFPSSEEVKAKVPNPERNQELLEKYGVQGFPTILLMNADGEVYAQTGYREGGPEKYVEHLDEIGGSGREALVSTKELVTAFEAAEGEAKVEALGKVLDLLGKLDGDSPFAAQLAAPARWAFEADASNEKGLKLRAVQALTAAGQVDEAVLAAAAELDPDNAEGLREEVVEALFRGVSDEASARAALAGLDGLAGKTFQDTERAFRMHFMGANWCSGPLADPERAKGYAKAALAIGTDDQEKIDFLQGLIDG